MEGVWTSFFLGGLPFEEDLRGLPTGRGLDGRTTAVLLGGPPRVLGGEASVGDTAIAARDGVDVPALSLPGGINARFLSIVSVVTAMLG